MKEDQEQPSAIWWKTPSRQWALLLQEREEQVFLVLTLFIGALVGAIVVAFILLTERFGTTLLRGRRGLAAAAGSGGGLPGDGLSAVPLLSGSSRQWCSTNESCPVCTRRSHYVGHGFRKILLYSGYVGMRNPARARGPGGASGCGTSVRVRAKVGVAPGKGEGTPAGGRGGRGRCRVQHTSCGGAVCPRGSRRRSSCAGSRLRGSGLRYFLGGVAPLTGK
jgi:hypothetical protein